MAHMVAKQDEKTVQSELHTFCKTTSMKGMSRIIRHEPRCLQVCWIMAIIFFLGVAIYQVGNQVILNVLV